MKKIDQKEKAVVIIGSGAGGGTMAFELTKAGIPCVCLEAGPFHKKEDYIQMLRPGGAAAPPRYITN